MDFLTLEEKLAKKQCPRWNSRQKRLHAYHLVQEYEFYEILKDQFADFSDRYKPSSGKPQYRKLDERRDAMDYRLPEIITRDVCGMLFGEGKFPIFLFESQADTDAAAEIIKAAMLDSVMLGFAELGACGSVVIVPEIFVDVDQFDGKEKNRLYLDMWPSWECEPVFRKMQPGVLESVTRTWLVKREELIAEGYPVEQMEAEWSAKIDGDRRKEKRQFPLWYKRRNVRAQESQWFLPVPKEIYEKKEKDEVWWNAWVMDPIRTTTHELSFCSAIWVAPGARPGKIDGPCLYRGAINNQLFIQRVMSVGGQAIATAGSPMLATARKDGGSTGLQESLEALDGTDGWPTVSSSGNALDPESILEVDEVGGAWLVQLDGSAMTPMDAMVIRARALALENCGGSRITEDSLSGAKSGYAMELLNQALTYVAGKLRPFWGSYTITLIRMIAHLQVAFGEIDGIDKVLNPDAKLKSTSWGPWYEPSGQDLTAFVAAAVQACAEGAIDKKTMQTNIAPLFDVVDIEEMGKNIEKEQQERADTEHANAMELATAAPPKPPGGS